MASQSEIRKAITDKIIEALQNGGLPPWRRPWLRHENAGLPTNVISKNRYSGINPILLQMASIRHGFTSKFWGTFRQWQEIDGRVKQRPTNVPPGQWGTNIVFFKPVTKIAIDDETEEVEKIRFGVLKTYTVFNIDQVEGECLDKFRVGELNADTEFIDYEPAEEAIMATGAEIHFGGDRAFYARPTNGDGDYIQLPPKAYFSERKEYYATAFHELAHWSEVRTNWTGSYAEGELRAEIAASYMMAELRVPQSDDLSGNHHAYLQHWLKALRSDPRFIFSCATAATKAADFVLSFRSSEKREPAIIV